jgi:hypothetical protein
MDDISKNVDFRVFRELAGAMDLDVPLTILNPLAEVLKRVSQARASTVAQNIIGHHDQHGNRNGSY